MAVEAATSLIVAEAQGRYTTRPPLVVDCNVVAALLFHEIRRDVALQAVSGKDLFVPDLLAHEFVNVAARKYRAGLKELAQQALLDFQQIELTPCPCDPEGVFELALAHDLTAYDAAYLWLAADLRAPLATFDRRLGRVALVVLRGR